MSDTTPEQIRRYLENLRDEQEGVTLYNRLAAAEKDPRLADIYRRFAEVEQKHVDVWSKRLAEAGVSVPAYRPSWRTRTLGWLAQRLGVGAVLPTVTSIEQGASGKYRSQPEAGAEMTGEEASHARLLSQIASSGRGGLEGSAVAQLEGRHHTGGGNALRAAVLGANDGLVSNLSLVMGVAGAELGGLGGDGFSASTVLVTGLAGLLAGACSMALGEWLSVQSSRELYQRQLEIEKAEIENTPQEEIEELALIYESRGVKREQAKELATQILSDKKNALSTLAREELGIDPEELGGSAWVAAITSFFLFALGAILPVIPFTFMSGRASVIASAALSTLGLYGIGAAITLFTGRSAVRSGLRMVVFGLSAAAITFVIGRLIGVSIGG